MDQVVLDSNILSYILNGDSRAEFYEERIRGYRQTISFQTLQESRYGASKRVGEREERGNLICTFDSTKWLGQPGDWRQYPETSARIWNWRAAASAWPTLG